MKNSTATSFTNQFEERLQTPVNVQITSEIKMIRKSQLRVAYMQHVS